MEQIVNSSLSSTQLVVAPLVGIDFVLKDPASPIGIVPIDLDSPTAV